MTNPNRTLIVGLVDRSGSMAKIKSDVEGEWDNFIKKQREVDAGDEVFVSLYQFDWRGAVESILETVYELKPIAEVSNLQLDPRGGTPLYDAIGLTIHKTGGHLAALDEDQRPGQVYFAILTDGYENSSREYTQEQVLNLVTEHQDIWKWEFHFMGVGIDAYAVGARIGVKAATTYVADATPAGVRKSYGASAQSIVQSRVERK